MLLELRFLKEARVRGGGLLSFASPIPVSPCACQHTNLSIWEHRLNAKLSSFKISHDASLMRFEYLTKELSDLILD